MPHSSVSLWILGATWENGELEADCLGVLDGDCAYLCGGAVKCQAVVVGFGCGRDTGLKESSRAGRRT